MKNIEQQYLSILSVLFFTISHAFIDAVIPEWQSLFSFPLWNIHTYYIYSVYIVVDIKSSSEYLEFPPAVHLILADYTKYGSCCEMLLHRHLQVLEIWEHVVARTMSCPSCLPVEFLWHCLRRFTLQTLQFIALGTSAVLMLP